MGADKEGKRLDASGMTCRRRFLHAVQLEEACLLVKPSLPPLPLPTDVLRKWSLRPPLMVRVACTCLHQLNRHAERQTKNHATANSAHLRPEGLAGHGRSGNADLGVGGIFSWSPCARGGVAWKTIILAVGVVQLCLRTDPQMFASLLIQLSIPPMASPIYGRLLQLVKILVSTALRYWGC